MPHTAPALPSSVLSTLSISRSNTACAALALLSATLLMGCAQTEPAPKAPQTSPPAHVSVSPSSAVTAADANAALRSDSKTQRSAEAAEAAAYESKPALAPLQTFEDWKQAFTARAASAGISPATLRHLAHVQLRTSVISSDRAQPEFTRTPWQYLDSAVSALRVKNGKLKMQQAAAPLQAAAQRYGVPASVIAAIWGMESNYGSNFGNISALDALATLAFEGRRAAWAEKELIAALRIIDNGDIDAAQLQGSWAGAMGHTQFLPSVFLQYAVDADGDGRRDIWGSLADVTASTANYIASAGWSSAEPWATEVRLPAGFDYARTELSQRQDSSAWAREGVQTVDGQSLPPMANASIITPAGARGPAFMVGANFRAILRYNNSVNYALGVGLLSQQLASESARPNAGVITPWPRDLAALSREQTRALQVALNQRGFSAGSADGVMGPATRAGLRRFQQSQGLIADGYPTLELLDLLQGS